MRKLILILTLILSVLLITSCGEKDEITDVRVLNVYNWGEYISDGSEGSLDSNRAFEEWYLETYGEEEHNHQDVVDKLLDGHLFRENPFKIMVLD